MSWRGEDETGGGNKTKTRGEATGGIETDTRTNGDYKHGQDNICDFQQG